MSSNDKYPGSLLESPSYLLWRLNSQHQHALKDALKPFNLTYTEFIVLGVLFFDIKLLGISSQKLLARHSKLDKMVVSQAVRELQNKQLILRRKGVVDGRAISLRPSGQGRLVIQQARATVQIIDKALDKQVH